MISNFTNTYVFSSNLPVLPLRNYYTAIIQQQYESLPYSKDLYNNTIRCDNFHNHSEKGYKNDEF